MNPFYLPFVALLLLVATQDGVRADEKLPGYEDGAHVVLTGVIEEIDDDEFILNYGPDTIEVELDDWGWDAADTSRSLQVGDRVMVSGEIDDDWFDDRELEADNLYVLHTFTYHVSADENPAFRRAERSGVRGDATFVSVRGEVTGIDGESLTVASGGRSIEVDASTMETPPVGPKTGERRIDVGDRVYVYGEASDAFWDERTLTAELVLKIDDVQDQGSGDEAMNRRQGRR